jgi:hypothetical protein
MFENQACSFISNNLETLETVFALLSFVLAEESTTEVSRNNQNMKESAFYKGRYTKGKYQRPIEPMQCDHFIAFCFGPFSNHYL